MDVVAAMCDVLSLISGKRFHKDQTLQLAEFVVRSDVVYFKLGEFIGWEKVFVLVAAPLLRMCLESVGGVWTNKSL